eukprot:scaffold203426_cov17-Tisochrysis_lutea.AAC.2
MALVTGHVGARGAAGAVETWAAHTIGCHIHLCCASGCCRCGRDTAADTAPRACAAAVVGMTMPVWELCGEPGRGEGVPYRGFPRSHSRAASSRCLWPDTAATLAAMRW